MSSQDSAPTNTSTPTESDSAAVAEAGADLASEAETKAAPQILAIDDERRLLEMLSGALTKMGMEVETAESGEEALEKLTMSTQMMLVDLAMPGMSGIETIEAARKQGWEGKVIIITAHPDKQTILEGHRLKVDGYLTKPFDIDDLFERISTSLCLETDLHLISVPDEFHDIIVNSEKSVPVFSSGEFCLRWRRWRTSRRRRPRFLTMVPLCLCRIITQ
jgi:DNA-binding response OmpR family regulator